MGALATRGHRVAGHSAYLCPYRPPSATEELAIWREQALTRQAMWQCLEKIDPKTGEVLSAVFTLVVRTVSSIYSPVPSFAIGYPKARALLQVCIPNLSMAPIW